MRTWDLRIVLHNYAFRLQKEILKSWRFGMLMHALVAPYAKPHSGLTPPRRPAFLDWRLTP